ncbi:hypothetical protein ACEQ8H_007654 [Pleosporales sp. CAS-2024a]
MPELAEDDHDLGPAYTGHGTCGAVILSIGEGNASRIYLTRDAGKSWKPTFINQEPLAFYDCMAFENDKHGLAMSDPVNGKFRLIETLDGGASWQMVDPAGIPAALTGEAGFAASSPKHGVAVGGDFENPTGNGDISSWSEDGGATWKASDVFPAGYRSGVSWVPGRGKTAIAVVTSGSDYTLDGGRTWKNFDNRTFDAVECVGKNVCWASGSQGRVTKLSLSSSW